MSGAAPSRFARPFEILLVEDDDDDVLLITRALKSDQIPSHISRVDNGIKALEFLRKLGEYKAAPRPDLVLLDLNMPCKDGREVLREIKEDPVLGVVPVVVLTTSDSERDILVSYQRFANSFVTKPTDLEDLRRVLGSISSYWFTTVCLPPSQPDA